MKYIISSLIVFVLMVSCSKGKEKKHSNQNKIVSENVYDYVIERTYEDDGKTTLHIKGNQSYIC